MIKAGTIVVCPDCFRPQVRTTKDLAPGQQLKEAAFESLGFDMENSLRMGCIDCGTSWFRKHPRSGKSQLYTEDNGWISFEKDKPKKELPSKPMIIT